MCFFLHHIRTMFPTVRQHVAHKFAAILACSGHFVRLSFSHYICHGAAMAMRRPWAQPSCTFQHKSTPKFVRQLHEGSLEFEQEKRAASIDEFEVDSIGVPEGGIMDAGRMLQLVLPNEGRCLRAYRLQLAHWQLWQKKSNLQSASRLQKMRHGHGSRLPIPV